MDSVKLDKDIVVLKYPGVFKTDETRTNVKGAFKAIFADWGQDVHVLLLEEGMDISVIKRDV